MHHTLPNRAQGPRPSVRAAAFALAAAFIVVSAACNDSTGFEASRAVVTDTFTVYSISGTPPGFPSALSTTARSIVRADGDFSFDIAFDIDAQGRALLYPVRLVGGQYTADRQVGLQKATVTFEQLLKAPNNGYKYDSVMVSRPGDAVVVQVISQNCGFALSPAIYSKLAIDVVDVVSRSIKFRMTHDPNCGFRSFAPGVPKD